MWAIRGPLSRRQSGLFAALGLLIPLGVWWLVSSGSTVDKVFLPSPVDVFNRLIKWYVEDDLLSDMGISIYRVTSGFFVLRSHRLAARPDDWHLPPGAGGAGAAH